MTYLKSVLAGLFALIVIPISAVIITVAGTLIYTMVNRPSEGSIGWDPVSLVRQRPIVWLIFVLIFFAGFMWEYRRLT